jgi:hypothetical protein
MFIEIKILFNAKSFYNIFNLYEITERRKINYYYILNKMSTLCHLFVYPLMTTLLKHFIPLVGSRLG